MENPVQLCRRHHRLVHEGGFGCARQADDTLVFMDQRGNILADYASLPSIDQQQLPVEWIDSRVPDLDIDPHTCAPLTTAGERMDWHLAVGHLFAGEHPRQPDH